MKEGFSEKWTFKVGPERREGVYPEGYWVVKKNKDGAMT
jgi:hypothetical protein